MQLYSVIFKRIDISKAAKTKVPATKEKEILITVKCPLSIGKVGWNSFHLDLGKYQNRKPPRLKSRLRREK